MVNTLEQNFYEHVRKLILARIDRNTEFVVKGAAEDYANYKERVGELREANAILTILDDVVKAIDPY